MNLNRVLDGLGAALEPGDRDLAHLRKLNPAHKQIRLDLPLPPT
jgi:hypothetical protein